MEGKQIVEGLRSGDSRVAEWLLDEFERPLLAYFHNHLPDRSLAEDATQEVFLRLIDAIRRGSLTSIRSPRTLLFTMAHNLSVDIMKYWARRPRLQSLHATPVCDDGAFGVAPEAVDESPGPRRAAIAGEEADSLHSALARLDPLTREVVVLRHLEGFSSREVASILNLAEGTVWSRLHRGLVALREVLMGAAEPLAAAPSPASAAAKLAGFGTPPPGTAVELGGTS